jgi:hypothetical protein
MFLIILFETVNRVLQFFHTVSLASILLKQSVGEVPKYCLRKNKPKSSNAVFFNLRGTIFRDTESSMYMITALNVEMDEVALQYPLPNLGYSRLDNIYFHRNFMAFCLSLFAGVESFSPISP